MAYKALYSGFIRTARSCASLPGTIPRRAIRSSPEASSHGEHRLSLRFPSTSSQSAPAPAREPPTRSYGAGSLWGKGPANPAAENVQTHGPGIAPVESVVRKSH